MTSGSPGSDYEPHSITADRLIMWRRLSVAGLSRREIADRLGISRGTLDQLVGRARRNGHPDAIHHPDAAEPGTSWRRIAYGHHRPTR